MDLELHYLNESYGREKMIQDQRKVPPHVFGQLTPFLRAESNFTRKIERFQKKNYLNPMNRSKVMQFLRYNLFAKFIR